MSDENKNKDLNINNAENVVPLSKEDESLVEKMVNYSIINDDDAEADSASKANEEEDKLKPNTSTAGQKSISANFNSRSQATYLGKNKNVYAPGSDPTIRSSFVSSKKRAENFVAASGSRKEKKKSTFKKGFSICAGVVIVLVLLAGSVFIIQHFGLIDIIKNLLK